MQGGGVKDAAFRVKIKDLPDGQNYAMAIMRKTQDNLVPAIAVNIPVTVTGYLSSGVAFSNVQVDFSAWRMAFNASIASPVVPTDFRIINPVTGNYSGIIPGAYSNPSTDPSHIEIDVSTATDPYLSKVLLIFDITGDILS